MAMNFDDAIGGYVTEISEKINETRDEFILESLMPYAQTVESRINKQELERVRGEGGMLVESQKAQSARFRLLHQGQS